MGDGLGGGAAMLAGQVTGLGDLPDGEEWGFVEVQSATGGDVVHRLHGTSYEIGQRNRGGRTGKRVLRRGIELTFVIKVNQDSADRMVSLGKETVMKAYSRAP